MPRRRKLPDIAVAQCDLSSLDEDEKDIRNRVKHMMKPGKPRHFAHVSHGFDYGF